MTIMRWAGFFTISLGVTLWCIECVAAGVCYFGQEADDVGNLRWVMPGKDYVNRCSCTEIRPGGVNHARRFQLIDDDGQEFIDKPMFTQDQESIQQFFNCTADQSATTAGHPIATAAPLTATAGPQTVTGPYTAPAGPTDDTPGPSTATADSPENSPGSSPAGSPESSPAGSSESSPAGSSESSHVGSIEGSQYAGSSESSLAGPPATTTDPPTDSRSTYRYGLFTDSTAGSIDETAGTDDTPGPPTDTAGPPAGPPATTADPATENMFP